MSEPESYEAECDICGKPHKVMYYDRESGSGWYMARDRVGGGGRYCFAPWSRPMPAPVFPTISDCIAKLEALEKILAE